jgi:hypothetical protein
MVEAIKVRPSEALQALLVSPTATLVTEEWAKRAIRGTDCRGEATCIALLTYDSSWLIRKVAEGAKLTFVADKAAREAPRCAQVARSGAGLGTELACATRFLSSSLLVNGVASCRNVAPLCSMMNCETAWTATQALCFAMFWLIMSWLTRHWIRGAKWQVRFVPRGAGVAKYCPSDVGQLPWFARQALESTFCRLVLPNWTWLLLGTVGNLSVTGGDTRASIVNEPFSKFSCFAMRTTRTALFPSKVAWATRHLFCAVFARGMTQGSAHTQSPTDHPG